MGIISSKNNKSPDHSESKERGYQDAKKLLNISRHIAQQNG
jgi:hypothetical protein